MERAASLKTFMELLKDEKHDGIVIPRIQRDYAQGRTGEYEIRNEFLDALHSAIAKSDGSLSLDFVYGSIDEDSGKFIPLDGQQRLTTLFLLHLYASWHKGNIEQAREKLSRFTYRTRESASDFIEKLMANVPPLSETPSHWLKDQPWFPYSWNEDPTIISMLVMLDAIAEKFSDVASVLWDRLVEDKAIVFQFLDIKNLGMTDDIYIKMNSRGLPLTEFEKTKVLIKQKLDVIYGKNSKYTDGFMRKIDGAWTDALWNYHSDNNPIIDDYFVNIIHYALNLIRCERNADFVPDYRETLTDAIRDVLCPESTDSAKRLEELLDILLAFDSAYFDGYLANEHNADLLLIFDGKTDYLNRCIDQNGNSFGYAAQLMLYAFVIKQENGISDDIFISRLRHLRNIIQNSAFYMRPDFFASQIQDTRTIISCGVERIDISSSHFNRGQIDEEIEKQRLADAEPLVADDLYFLEDTSILQGSVAIVGIDNTAYFRKAGMLLNLAEGNLMVLLRAMLSSGDYHQLYRGWRWHFGSRRIDMVRELFHESMNVELFENTRAVLLSLLDRLGDDISMEALDSIITDFDFSSIAKDWRYYMLKYPVILSRSDFGRFYAHSYDPYSLVIMSTESRASDNSWSAVFFAAVYQEGENGYGIIPQLKDAEVRVNYRSLSFLVKDKGLRCSIECNEADPFSYRVVLGDKEDELCIGNDGEHDTEDRVLAIRQRIFLMLGAGPAE